MKFGIMLFPTDYSIGPADLARATEELGFESLWFPEHTHIPRDHTPWPGGAELPRHYSHALDPFVGLAAAAAVTSRLRLGSGVCLVVQRDPITLAKAVASLDHLSNGRALFGIGAGWNREEIANHGTDPRLRWRVLKERVEAMKAIWTEEAAEYHGRFVDFGPLWSWPKPVQRPHPPILMGGDGRKAVEGLLEYCDEWMPHPDRTDRPFAERVAEANRRAAELSRGPIPVTAYGGEADPAKVEVCQAAGAERYVFRLPSASAADLQPLLQRCAEVARSFR